MAAILNIEKGDFDVFRPTGRLVAPTGVKFDVVERTEGRLLRAKFHSHRCNYKFYELSEYKQAYPYRHILARDFYELFRICGHFLRELNV